MSDTFLDWGKASPEFDKLHAFVGERNLSTANEAQTRFDVIDRLLKDVLGWQHGQIKVEEHIRKESNEEKQAYVDYILRVGDSALLIEAKKVGATFPSPTAAKALKLSGSVLGRSQVRDAIAQANDYGLRHEENFSALVVTNGLCWIIFEPQKDLAKSSSFGFLFFPFQVDGGAEKLFRALSPPAVENGSIAALFEHDFGYVENRLLACVRDSNARIARNSVADLIAPALHEALYSEAMLHDAEKLRRCYVKNETRTKFDNVLGMYLAPTRPPLVRDAKKLRREGAHQGLGATLAPQSGAARPVTLIIGPVGVGKSTFIQYFEKVSGHDLLREKKAHWIYIDFEEMGREGSPRQFIYDKAKEYILSAHPENPTDYDSAIRPAYAAELDALVAGPWAPIRTNQDRLNERISDYITGDLSRVEPFVEKILRHLARKSPCILVLDNVDLYEDEDLETRVFSEGVAFAKRVQCNVIVAIRDTTYIRHKNDSSFDAYELNLFWLDPPAFAEVLSKRLSYSKAVLDGTEGRLKLPNGVPLVIPNLGTFFDLVQKSILDGEAGKFVDYVSNQDIRRGIMLVRNFLTSGHIQADQALKMYVGGDTSFVFPFHEVFKGTMLGQWQYYKEKRAECINLFDARLESTSQQLLRLYILQILYQKAKITGDADTAVGELVDLFLEIGTSESRLIQCLRDLQLNALLRSSETEISAGGSVVITRSGGYFVRHLSYKFVYAEACLFDTAVADAGVFDQLTDKTSLIDTSRDVIARLEIRKERISMFLNYLRKIEEENVKISPSLERYATMAQRVSAAEDELERIIRRNTRRRDAKAHGWPEI